MKERTKLALFFSVFGAIGAIALVIGLVMYAAASEPANWPTTNGVVTESWVEYSYTRENHYLPIVKYTYSVDGLNHIGDKVRPSSFFTTDAADAYEITSRYYVGASVVVHYNPNDPSNAVLETNIALDNYAFLLLGGSFTAIGILGAIWAVRSKSEVSIVVSGRYPRNRMTTYNPGVQWRSCGTIDVGPRERKLWSDKPVRTAFLLTSGRQSIVSTVAFAAASIAFVIIGLLVAFPVAVIGSVFLAIAVGGVIWQFYSQSKRWPNIEYVLTDRRILMRGGGNMAKYIDLENIDQVLLNMTLIDSIYQTGSLVISDTTGVDISCVKDPEGVKKKIEDAAKWAKKMRFEERAGIADMDNAPAEAIEH